MKRKRRRPCAPTGLNRDGEIDSSSTRRISAIIALPRRTHAAGLLSATKLGMVSSRSGCRAAPRATRARRTEAADDAARVEAPAGGDGSVKAAAAVAAVVAAAVIGRPPACDGAEVPIDVESSSTRRGSGRPRCCARHRTGTSRSRAGRTPRAPEASDRSERTDSAEQIGASGERLTGDEPTTWCALRGCAHEPVMRVRAGEFPREGA